LGKLLPEYRISSWEWNCKRVVDIYMYYQNIVTEDIAEKATKIHGQLEINSESARGSKKKNQASRVFTKS
jgi:hypothetical protein